MYSPCSVLRAPYSAVCTAPAWTDAPGRQVGRQTGRLANQRQQPKPPHSFLWGHLRVFGEAMAVFPRNPHPQAALTHLHQTLGLPDLFYLDLWPLAPSMLVAASAAAAAEMTQVQALPKHGIIDATLAPMVGSGSIPAVNGRPGRRPTACWRRPSAPPTCAPCSSASPTTSAPSTPAWPAAPPAASPSAPPAASPSTSRTSCRAWCSTPSSTPVLGTAAGGGERDAAAADKFRGDIKLPMHTRPLETATWNPVRRWRLSRQRKQALADSAAWLKGQALKRYAVLRDSPTSKAPTSVMGLLSHGADRGRGPGPGAAARPEAAQAGGRPGLAGTLRHQVCFLFLFLS